MLAPQPFYQERGTLIAIDLLSRALSERGEQVDLLTFHLGDTPRREGLVVHRIRPKPAPRQVPPGFSLAKLWCDLFLFLKAWGMVRRNRYDLIHAVEEAGFMAMAIGGLHRVPYVLDMDSSMADQLADKYPPIRWARGALRWLESLPIRSAAAVVPMCEDLASRARRYSRGPVTVLADVSLAGADPAEGEAEDFRQSLALEGPVAMYIGNLERYQGIDLLLEAFKDVASRHPAVSLVVIGGAPADLERYRREAMQPGLAGRVHFVGPRPIQRLSRYMGQADVLVSPRVQGTNTPMKIYSYMDSGTAIVATDLPTHTQVLSSREAVLVPPQPGAMASAILELLADPGRRCELAEHARTLVARCHSWEAFRTTVNEIYDELATTLARHA